MNRWSRRLRLAALAAVAVVAAVVGVSLAPASGRAQQGEDVDWPNVNGTLDGQRYSPLTGIDTSNVKGLKVAWRFRVPKIIGAESYPVIVGRTAYVTTTYGVVFALDAATGKKQWSFDPRGLKNGKVGGLVGVAVHGFPNRGVAVGDNRVYGVTPNAVLYALDQPSGRLVWKTSLGDALFLSESAADLVRRHGVRRQRRLGIRGARLRGGLRRQERQADLAPLHDPARERARLVGQRASRRRRRLDERDDRSEGGPCLRRDR
jgi:glucose dehydrogenase